ncbi:hypothetical protein [Methanopyrus kandleri]
MRPVVWTVRIAAAAIILVAMTASGFLFAVSLTGKSPVDPQLVMRMSSDLARGDYDAFNRDFAMAYLQLTSRLHEGLQTLLEYLGIKARFIKEEVKKKLFRYRVRVANSEDVCTKLMELAHVDDIAKGKLMVYADTKPEPNKGTKILIRAIGYVEKVKIKGETIIIYSTPYYIEAEGMGIYNEDKEVIIDVNTIKLRQVRRL